MAFDHECEGPRHNNIPWTKQQAFPLWNSAFLRWAFILGEYSRESCWQHWNHNPCLISINRNSCRPREKSPKPPLWTKFAYLPHWIITLVIISKLFKTSQATRYPRKNLTYTLPSHLSQNTVTDLSPLCVAASSCTQSLQLGTRFSDADTIADSVGSRLGDIIGLRTGETLSDKNQLITRWSQ